MGGKPIEGIDPAVLEDDGVFYYTWGQGHCHMARLNEDMCTLDPDTFREALITHEDGREGFHEGSSLRKIGEYYCLVYASEYTEEYPNRGAAPTCLDYALSDSVYGPYKRAGRIIDNTGIDPSSWNNHGSVIKIGGQWYVFYHGSSNNTKYTRRCRVERIDVDEKSGRISQAEMTSSGFSQTLETAVTIPAACGFRVGGGACFTQKDGGFPLIHVTDGSSVSYRWFDFGEKGVDPEICADVRVLADGQLEVWINGEKAAGCPLQPDRQTEEAKEGKTERGMFRLPLKDVKGRTELTFVFRSRTAGELAELYSFCVNIQNEREEKENGNS